VGRGERAHVPASRLACREVRFAWTDAGLSASAEGGAVYEEAADGEWRNLRSPLACPQRLVVCGDEDQAAQIFADYQNGGDVDERIELFDPRRRDLNVLRGGSRS
ncbi:MAG: hypothetical protein KY475_11905, partial [Planctomycetes bacterium]|nr:hypothetical protein [Planctomycetota bacterium]